MAEDRDKVCRTAKDKGEILAVAKRMARVPAKGLAKGLDAIGKGKSNEKELSDLGVEEK